MGIDGERIRLPQPGQVGGGVPRGDGEGTVGAVHMEPAVVRPGDGRQRRQGIDSTRAHGAGGADHEEREVAGRRVRLDAAGERVRVHALARVRLDPADGIGAEAGDIGRLVQPGMGLGRSVEAHAPRPRPGHAFGAQVPIGARAARGEGADDVAHVAAAHEQATAVGGIAQKLGHPAHRLGLDLGRRGHQVPGRDVGADRGREEVRQHAHGCGRASDVAPRPGVAAVADVIEQQVRRLVDEGLGVGAVFGQPFLADQRAYGRRCRIGRHSPGGERIDIAGDAVHQVVAEGAELFSARGEGRGARPGPACLRLVRHHPIPFISAVISIPASHHRDFVLQ